MSQNVIVVEGPVDYEDTIEGTNFIYDVKRCDVEAEKGELTWDHVIFPIIPVPTGCNAADQTPMISRRNPVRNHVSSMNRVGDDVLALLRDRGVEVVIIDNPSPAVTCGD